MYKNTWFVNWYPNFKIKNKREEVKAVIRRLAPNVKYSDFLVDTFSIKKKGKRGRKPVLIENSIFFLNKTLSGTDEIRFNCLAE